MSRVFGIYTLDERIGVGGMGEVYRATKKGPEGFETPVALKLILPHLAREKSFRALFSMEARLAALLKHPNIISVNGFDILEGTPFIEMEYIEGVDLASLLKNQGEDTILPLEESVHILHCAARGLAYAHSFNREPGGTGIVHRDFNPHNILISVEGEVKIADFGIARAVMGETAASGTLMGKLAYMSPEQISGKKLDQRSDLFSLGITAYQLLSGRHPFLRASEAGTVRAVQEASCQPLSEAAPFLSPLLAETVTSLLSASPEDRTAKARNVADIFEGLLEPTSVKRLGKRVKDLAAVKQSVPEENFTGQTTAPTLPVKAKARFLLPAVLLILAAAVLTGFLKTDRSVDITAAIPGEEKTAIDISSPPIEPIVENRPSDPVSMLVDTDPTGARVHEGDEIVGITPLTVVIPAGVVSRKLSVSLDRYEPAEVSLERDSADTKVMVTLAPMPTGTIKINAIPWARVGFRGKDMGVTPVVIEDTPVGVHDLVLSNRELGARREVKVRVSEDTSPVYVVDMATGEIMRNSD